MRVSSVRRARAAWYVERVAWRSESWADIVARAGSARSLEKRRSDDEDRAALAARAEEWTFQKPGIAAGRSGVVLGEALDSVEVAFPQIYHFEPVDPWPSVLIGWVDRQQSYRAVLTPTEADSDLDAFAAAVEEIAASPKLARAIEKGWLLVPAIAWEPCDAMPGERDEGPQMRGYRMAPEAPDPVIARRARVSSAASLLGWVWARLGSPARRIDPLEVVLTQRFVYARTRIGARLRIPSAALRTMRRTSTGDAVYVFGRHTELLLVHQDGCELDRELAQRAGRARAADAG